jgi:hypothetical protein
MVWCSPAVMVCVCACVRAVDRIIFLHEGRVVWEGSVDEFDTTGKCLRRLSACWPAACIITRGCLPLRKGRGL